MQGVCKVGFIFLVISVVISCLTACCDVVNRGVAYWVGQIFVGTFDGYLVALDAQTGVENWKVLTHR